MSKISVSIVAYNNKCEILDLLADIYRVCDTSLLDIFVIDNCSTDDVTDVIKDKYPDVSGIKLDKNLGFGGGHNVILDKISSEYHVIVNPDIRLETDIFSELLCYLEAAPDVCIVTPKILNEDKTEQHLPKRKPSLKYLMARRLPFLPNSKELNEEYTMANANMSDPFDIDFCTGCFFMIRSEIFKKLKGFDQRFFMYFEDADITLRAKKFGRTVFNPNFFVIHKWARESSKSLKFLIIHLTSMIKFFTKKEI